jgi:hypothetical protein
MTVNCREANTAIIHLTSKNFIAKEPISKNTAVRIGTKQAFLSGNIWQITKQNVHGIILLSGVIQMHSMLINLEITKHALQKKETVKIFMFPAWSIVKHTY